MPVPPPTVPHCAHCRNPLGACFEITKFDSARVNRGAVKVCSLLCMVNWACTYGTQRTKNVVRGVQTGVQDAIRIIAETLRGTR